MKHLSFYSLLLFCVMTLSWACNKDDDDNKPQVITGAGNIQAAIDEYRTLLGTNNGSAVGTQNGGRREINWDGVPDSLAAPYFLPHDFFKARGADFTTPGAGV